MLRDTMEDPPAESPARSGATSRPAVTPEPAVAARHAAVASEAATQFEMPAVQLNDTFPQPMVFQDERLAASRGKAPTIEAPESRAARVSAPTEAAPVTPAPVARVSAPNARVASSGAHGAERARIQRKARPEDKPTEISMPAVSDVQLAAPRAPAAPARSSAPKIEAPKIEAPKIVAPKPAAPKPPAATPRKFSETAWFMAAVDPNELVEREGAAGSLTDAAVMTDRYAPEEPLPDEVRKNFSLNDGAPRPRRRR